MAKNNELIKWHGQVGKTLVGYKLRGEHIVRAYSCSVHDPNTLAQQEVREKFKFVSQLIHKIGGVYKTGYASMRAPTTREACSSPTSTRRPLRAT